MSAGNGGGGFSVRPVALAAALSALALAGCGLDVQSPDLFLLTRTGPGGRLTLLVNDSGTISCDGRRAQSLPDPLLLQARDLATSLDNDAQAGMHIAASADTVYRYSVRLQDGTITFPDTAGAHHQELAQAELFALQAAQNPCKVPSG